MRTKYYALVLLLLTLPFMGRGQLNATFDDVSGTGGNTGGWSGSIAGTGLGTYTTGGTWTHTNVFRGDKCVKLATSGAAGSITTPAVGISGTLSLSFRAGSWSGDGTIVTVSLTGGGTLSTSSFTLSNAAFSTYTATISSATTSTRIIFSSASGKRFFLDDIVVASACTTPTQSFATDPVAKNIGDAAFTNTFTTNSTGAVTYSSNATSVATVNASSGLVTIVGSGTAVITASQAADATYCAASKTYTLNVSACAAPTAPTAFSATTTTTTAALNWTAGNGAGRAAFLNAGSFTSAVPATATVYTGNAAFGSGTAFDGGFAVSVGTGNSVNVTGLTANMVYNAKVFEYNNTQGNACYNIATPLTGTLTTVSNAPTASAASSVSATGFMANWTAPATQGAATFTYTLDVSTDPAFPVGVNTTTTTGITSGTTSQAVAGLTANTTYYYRLRAVNAGGSSVNSSTITVITLPAAPPAIATTANCDATILNAYTGGQSSTYFWQGTNATGTDQTQPATVNYTATVSGTYYVRAFANSQWSAATSVAVTIARNPAVTTQPSSTSVGRGSTATFTVVATNPNGYQWQENTGSSWANITNGTTNGVTYSGATTTTLSIGSTTLAMSGYQYRVVVGATSPCNVSATSNAATLTVTPTSLATDYFRSRATGAYNSTSTWESSADSVSWLNATLVPTNAANSITIRSSDSVNVSAAGGTANHLYVFGILTFSQSLTIANDINYDMVVFNGAKVDHNGSVTLASGATALIRTGGRITVNGSLSLSTVGANTSYAFEDASTLDYIEISQPGIGTTFFPNATGYPILRFSRTPVGPLGGGTPTTINGRLEIAAGVTISFTSATRTIAGGITNNGATTFSSLLEISGANAVLEGTGTLTIGSNGMSILSAASVLLRSAVTINTASTGTITVNGILNTNNNILSGSARFATASGSSLTITNAGGIAAGTTSSGNIQTTGTRTYSTAATYTYQGSTAQISGDGLPTSVAGLAINNAAGLTLGRATTVTTLLTLTSGNITTTTTNLLTLSSGASVSGASASSYIDGPLRRNTAAGAAFSFPIGKNGFYQPATVTPVDATASNYTAEHFNGTEVSPGRSNKDTPTLRYVSANAYYDISRGTGGANATVTLSYNASNQVTDLSTLVIAHYTGGRWISEGGTASGNTTSGTVTSNIVSSFSPFAIGSGSSNQPLPIRLLSFEVRKEAFEARLNWALGTTDGGEVIVVERSADGKTFAEIARQEVTQNAHLSQSFTDYAPLTGTNYYRLRIIGINGEESFSKTLLVSFGGKAVEGIRIYPNPARDVLTLEWTNAEVPAHVTLHNPAGQLVWTTRVASGNVLSVPVEKLAPGVYWITLEQEGKVERKKVMVGR